MATRFETSGFAFVFPSPLIVFRFTDLAESGGCNLSSERSGAMLRLPDQAPTYSVKETPVGLELIGELTNEDQDILGGEESAGLSIKGLYSKKDGILASWLAAKGVAPRQAVNAPFGRRIGNSH